MTDAPLEELGPVWENPWAAPVAAALRRSDGQLVASGRIPVQGS